MDPLSTYIDFARRMVARDRERDRLTMVFEIKGLGDAVRLARKGIADARGASADVGDSARRLVGALGDVKKQLDDAHDDLRFEAQTLGNSLAADEKLAPPSANGAGTPAGEANGGAPPDPALPPPDRASGDGAVNRLDRNGVNRADGDG